jgi:hypothetical protein
MRSSGTSVPRTSLTKPVSRAAKLRQSELSNAYLVVLPALPALESPS